MCAFPFSRGAASSLLATYFFFGNDHARAAEMVYLEFVGSRVHELVRIEPGTFKQGSPPDEVGRGADETQRIVTLTRPFLLGKYPVVRGQFAHFVAESGYRTEAETGPSGGFGWDGAKLAQRKDFTWRNPGFTQTDDDPVTLVTYKDATTFLEWLSRKSRRVFALPSEAQWEYAARAGGGPAMEAWHKENSANTTHPVGRKAANAWGLSDMLGNVWEWCEDWYGPYKAGDETDPVQRNANFFDKPRRVLRGGSWLREPKFCRPAARYRNDALSRNADNGFRVMTFDLEARAPSIVPPAVNLEATEAGVARPHPNQVEAPMAHSSPRAGVARFGLGWLLTLPVIGIILAVAIGIIRAIARAVGASPGSSGSSSSLPSRSSGQSPSVKVGEDGFWIMGESLAAGTQITCRYVVNGDTMTKAVRYEPGPQGQFIFTGSRPANVSVSAVGSGGGSTSTMGSTTSQRFGNAIGMGSQIDRDDDPPFRGHPRAY